MNAEWTGILPLQPRRQAAVAFPILQPRVPLNFQSGLEPPLPHIHMDGLPSSPNMETMSVANPEICSHPAHSWFRDPRPNPPPLRARKTILAEIFRENTTFSDYMRTILDDYYHVNDPELLNRELAAENENPPPTFPHFPLLPLEIREIIWEHAIPSRTLDVREIRNGLNYTSISSAVLPIPAIAFACREAYVVVMRLGTHLQLATPTGRHKRIRKFPIGFFVRGKDIPLFLPDPMGTLDSGKAKEKWPLIIKRPLDDMPVTEVTISTLVPAMESGVAAVNWSPPMRRPNMREYPGCILPRHWEVIKRAYQALGSNKKLRVLYIYYRPRYIEVSLAVPRESKIRERRPIGYDVEVQLLVDLYDDQRLAELSSLETVLEDQDLTGPRCESLAARNPGLCLDTCERANWEKNIEPAVRCQWLQLFEDELDDDTYRAVFPWMATLGYDPDHPWVREKLASAPEFRPAVLVHLSPVPPVHRNTAEDRERVDYANRVVALR